MPTEQEIRELLEQIDPEGKLPPDNVEAFIQELQEREKHPLKDGDSRTIIDIDGNERVVYFHTIRDQMEKEIDWREKAKLAARLISLSLD